MSAPYGPPQGAAAQGPPGGAPGGWGQPPAPRASLGTEKILSLAVAGIGVITFFLGLLDSSSATGSPSLFAGGGAFALAGFLVAGLLALGVILPKAGNLSFAVAVISFSTALSLLFVLFGASKVGAGFIVVLILGFVQAIVAIAAYLLGSGLIKAAPKPPPGYGNYGYGPGPGYGGPPAGYPGAQGQPPVGYPQQQPQPGQQGGPQQGYPPAQ